ncbi:MAG: GNAT family N-acetyltransferase [Actinomycetota bacterium]|nr:GNAT family N-acetyltransferase [Actinomycetota bacterium]
MADLVRPDVRLRTSFLAAMAEFVEEGRSGDDTMIGGDIARYGSHWGTAEGFAEYVAETLAERDQPRLPGWVLQTTLWWVEGSEYVGRISIRHQLNEHLREVGGHIGYDVRRSRRREGHATAMLRAMLPDAHALGIDPALVTCDIDNIASRRVIKAAGGVLEDQRGVKLRYWVPTR